MGPLRQQHTYVPKMVGYILVSIPHIKPLLNNLLSKERHSRGRSTISQITGSGSCTSMVNNSCYVLEQPLVRTIANEHHVPV
jgi:hypothetical protein